TMATIDGTSVSVPINTDPFELPEHTRSLVLPDRFHVLRPCPVNDAAADTSDVFHWSLFPDAARVHKDEERYRSLGLDPSRFTVMFPVAPWAIGSSRVLGLDGYYEILLTRIVDALTALDEPAELLFISLSRPRSAIVEGQGSVNVRYLGLLPYDVYDHLLCSC